MELAPRELYQTRRALVRLDDVVSVLKKAELMGEFSRLFTGTELKHCGTRMRSLGARLVVKDCLLLFLRAEAGHTRWDYREVEVENEHTGKPFVRLSGRARDSARNLNVVKILASLSHSKTWVAAMLVFCFAARLEHGARSREAC
jgi:phosphopantetheinyl transferase (holo-ACP synthase)